jgi:hypothetical protein
MQFILIFLRDRFIAAYIGGMKAFEKPSSTNNQVRGLFFGPAGMIQGIVLDGIKDIVGSGGFRKKLVAETINVLRGLNQEEFLKISEFNFEMPYSEIEKIEIKGGTWAGRTLKKEGDFRQILAKIGLSSGDSIY